MKKSEEQKAKIIHIARDNFAEKGFEATTTRQINREADIAEGLLYYYFPKGKREILDTIVHENVTKRMQVFESTSNEVPWTRDNAEERLIKVFENMWGSLKNEEGYQAFIITIRERNLLSDEQSEWLIKQIVGISDKVVRLMEVFKDDLRDDDMELADLVSIIMSMFQRVMYEDLLVRNRRSLSVERKEWLAREVHFVLSIALKN